MKLNERETFTVLAALQLWLEEKDEEETIGNDLLDTATNFGALEMLSDAEIEELCERLCCVEREPDVEREIAESERAIHQSDLAASEAGFHRKGV